MIISWTKPVRKIISDFSYNFHSKTEACDDYVIFVLEFVSSNRELILKMQYVSSIFFEFYNANLKGKIRAIVNMEITRQILQIETPLILGITRIVFQATNAK